VTFKDDIEKRIETDLDESADKVKSVLISAIEKTNYLKSDRVIRCIIFLAKGNLTDLDNYIESAIKDTRDVIFWAEYEGLKGKRRPKRIRDFDKSFEDFTIDVKE